MLFSLETAHTISSEDLPDDFFDLTIDDAKKIWNDIKRKRGDLENGGPLLTSALRSLEESKQQLRQLNKYRKSIIRVQFADRTVLQGIFNPSETVLDVCDFVREYLEDEQLDFYLFTTPPKCVLEGENRLIEIGCVPGALLHLGTDSLQNNGGSLLKSSVRDQFTTNSLASLAASKMRQENTRQGCFNENETNSEEIMDECFDGPSTSACAAGPSTTSTGAIPKDYSASRNQQQVKFTTEKVPKWFKPR